MSIGTKLDEWPEQVRPAKKDFSGYMKGNVHLFTNADAEALGANTGSVAKNLQWIRNKLSLEASYRRGNGSYRTRLLKGADCRIDPEGEIVFQFLADVCKVHYCKHKVDASNEWCSDHRSDPGPFQPHSTGKVF